MDSYFFNAFIQLANTHEFLPTSSFTLPVQQQLAHPVSAGSVVTRTVRDGARALGDFEAGGIVRHWNLSGGLGRLGISGNTERSALRYYFSDHLGSLRAVATSAGTVVEARDYYAFGLEMPGRTWMPSLKTREGYTGHQLDAETGFNYAGARYYNPGLARWMVVDPLAGDFPGHSPYNYVLGNPIRLTDPTGMAPEDYYKGADGRIVWANSSERTIKDADGNTYTNIGTDVLEFDGSKLTLRTQVGEPGNLSQRAYSYNAVAGRPGSDGSFDYSAERQAIPDFGPIPEGNYTIDPKSVQNITIAGRTIGAVSPRTAWPGGTRAWGEQRVWISPHQSEVFIPGSNSTVSRGGFTIHGGRDPGSAGCIDLTSSAPDFFRRLSQTPSASSGSTIYLRVIY